MTTYRIRKVGPHYHVDTGPGSRVVRYASPDDAQADIKAVGVRSACVRAAQTKGAVLLDVSAKGSESSLRDEPRVEVSESPPPAPRTSPVEIVEPTEAERDATLG